MNSTDFSASIHNKFDIEVIDCHTGKCKQRFQAFNVICHQLWERLLSTSYGSYFNAIAIGTGTGTPSASDTIMFDYLGGNSRSLETVSEELDYATGVYSICKKMSIDETQYVGSNISEIGISLGGGPTIHGMVATNSIATHALLQDMNGNIITIEKTDTDIITFYATVFVHFNNIGYQNNKAYINDDTTMTKEGLMRYIATGDRTPLDKTTLFRLCYSSGIYFFEKGSIGYTTSLQDKTLSQSTRFTVSEGNNGIISSISNGAITVDIDVLENTNWAITSESIGTGDGTKVDFSTKFPIKSNAKIFVDGVEDSSVTINTGLSTYFVHKTFKGISKDGFPCNHPLHNGRGYSSYYENVLMLPVDRCANHKYYVDDGIYFSDNLSGQWTAVSSLPSHGEGEYTVLDTPVVAKYWHYYGPYYPNSGYEYILINSSGFQTNIHFQTPPPAGAVITADYVPDCLPKDENHVFDFSLTITLGEYTGN